MGDQCSSSSSYICRLAKTRLHLRLAGLAALAAPVGSEG